VAAAGTAAADAAAVVAAAAAAGRAVKPLQARHEHRLRVGLLVHAAEIAKGDRENLLLRELGHVTVQFFAVKLHQRGRREVHQLGVGLALALLLGRLRQRRNLRKGCRQLEGG